jgi:YjbE family integral membrane protein
MIDLSYFGPSFWVALLEIMGINIVLSGDNAVVIALACRSLPPRQQRWGIAIGTAAAVVLRVIFTIFVVYLMAVPYLKLVGGLLLFWIAIKLVVPEEGDGHGEVQAANTLWAVVRIVAVADAVMSLDNVIGIAAAAQDDMVLIIIGLATSIPIVVLGSTLIVKIMGRFPIIIWAGGALLGWVAGEVIVSDIAVTPLFGDHADLAHRAGPALGAVIVVAAGLIIGRMAAIKRRKRVDLVS